MSTRDTVLILDFGGQYAHLIASRLRREGVWTEIVSPEEATAEQLTAPHMKGLVLSGGPQSVTSADSPRMPDGVLDQVTAPVLGICYGHQYLSHSSGGQVAPGHKREYGAATVTHTGDCPLFAGIPPQSTFWMSHWDQVTQLPEGFATVATTPECANAAIWNQQQNRFGIQFHPEVTHSEHGAQLLRNFLDITKAEKTWSIDAFLEAQKQQLQASVGDRSIFLFVSGGVDSTVCFALLSQIFGGDCVRGVFVDTGLLRQGERAWVETSLRGIGADLTVIDARDHFFKALAGAVDPEAKRNIIGKAFLDVQREYFSEHPLGENWVLAQGTIYPDTIETGATKHAAKIKTHHNRVPEIERMIEQGLVIEPVADLYKDEVRALGAQLGLPHELVWRHPFPGPGLGVRLLCADSTETMTIDPSADWNLLPIRSVGVQGDFRTYAHPALLAATHQNISQYEQAATALINQESTINRCIVPLALREGAPSTVSRHLGHTTPERVTVLQAADHIVTQALLAADLYSAVWQFPVVMVPLGFGAEGTESIILRPVESIDAMSASVGVLPWDWLQRVADEIIAAVPQVSGVLIDVTSKPPGTIEWE